MKIKTYASVYEKAVYDMVKTGNLFEQKQDNKIYNKAAKECVDTFSSWEQKFGTRYAIKLIKGVYVEALRMTTGLKPEVAIDTWLTRDRLTNFPKVFKENQKLLLQHRNRARISLSFLRAVDSIEMEAEKNLKNILDPSTGNEGVQLNNTQITQFLTTSKFTKRLAKTFNQKRMANIDNTSATPLHSTTKKGIGGPACLTAGYQTEPLNFHFREDLYSLDSLLREDGFKDVLEQNCKFYETNGDPLFKNSKFAEEHKIPEIDIWRMRHYRGRVSHLSGKGGKTRTVAIGNYWIQDVFFQLHKIVYATLRTLTSDGTYEQESQFERVNKAASVGPVWSYDLSAATDRFPVRYQQLVLNHLHPTLGDKWHRVLEQINFVADGKEIFYRVGQPMGLYSSWAVFTLCHHVLIQHCAFQERVRYPFWDYSIIGDDVSIWNGAVAKRYKAWCQTLDIKISKMKSFEPEEGHTGPSVAEFAKRVTNRGSEITAISCSQNSNAWHSVQELPELIRWLYTRQYPIGDVFVHRILEAFNITTEHRLQFICSLKIWSVITQCPIKGLDAILPNWFIVDKTVVLNLRITQFLKEGQQVWLSEDAILRDRARLCKALGSAVPSLHYFRKMRVTRLFSFMEQWGNLVNLQALISNTDDYENDPEFLKYDGKRYLDKLSEFEYIPEASYSKLLDGFLDTTSRAKLRAKYVHNLTKVAIKQLKPKGGPRKSLT